MRVCYIGKSFGTDGLTNGKEYEVTEYLEEFDLLRVIDDSEEDYLYSPKDPRPIAVKEHPGGHFEIVEDDAQGTLQKAIYG